MTNSSPEPGVVAPDQGMSAPGAYSITLRVVSRNDAGAVGRLSSLVYACGGSVTALDVVESAAASLVVDVTCLARDGSHAQSIAASINACDGFEVRKLSDRTFLLHLGGKLATAAKVPLKTRDDLSMAYTPGVGRVSQAIAANPDDARRLTIKRNSVAVVTDGSAVLGLGNLGPLAALPVMEGKAALFRRFAGIDAWPVCLDAHGADDIVAVVKAIAPPYGAINLEDIAAPVCFEVEARLRDALDLPVFHDDQHGTAIVVLAALRNALRVIGKKLSDARVTICGAGAAGTAIAKILLASGVDDLIVVDRDGILDPSHELPPAQAWLAKQTNRGERRGSLAAALRGADVLIGVSGPDLVSADDIATMAQDSVVFALANPVPEIDPALARRHAAVVATGRSDDPNQVNNVLAFPGVFRGALDVAATTITDAMELAAADAISELVRPEELSTAYFVPSIFHPSLTSMVATAVARAAEAGGVARRPLPMDAARVAGVDR